MTSEFDPRLTEKKGRPSRMDDPTYVENLHKYHDKMSLTDLCKLLKVSHPAISRHLQKLGLKKEAGSVLDEDADVIKILVEDGMEVAELADKFEVKTSTMYKYIARKGFKVKRHPALEKFQVGTINKITSHELDMDQNTLVERKDGNHKVLIPASYFCELWDKANQ